MFGPRPNTTIAHIRRPRHADLPVIFFRCPHPFVSHHTWCSRTFRLSSYSRIIIIHAYQARLPHILLYLVGSSLELLSWPFHAPSSRLPFDSFSLPSLSLPTSPLSRNSWDSKRTGVYCSLARPLPLRRPTFPSSLLFRLVLLQRINLLLIRRLNRLAFLSRRYNTSRMEHHRMANC